MPLYRYFHVYDVLDANRFIYAVYGWEWGAGFGIYDLSEHTNHRITGQGDFFGRRGNILFGTQMQADINTMQTLPLPVNIQQQLAEVTAMEDGYVAYDIDSKGRVLALSGLRSRHQDAKDIIISDLETGGILQELNLDIPDAEINDISFGNSTVLTILYHQKINGS